VLDWSAKHPADWRATWRMIEEKWDKEDLCPDGALRPFNIDARLNGAYIALGLLYGKGDFAQTLEITTRAGQDSDCNPSNAAGVLGTLLGYAAIPDFWKSGIPAIADTRFDFTQSSFNDVARTTLERAKKIVTKAGGSATASEMIIPFQEPKPAALEQWDMGVPDRRIDTLDATWTWTGRWKEEHYWDGSGISARKTTNEVGSEATLSFTGSAISLVGSYSREGGRADVYLDGEKTGKIDAYIVERTSDNDLWHAYGLKPGKHTLRIVPRDDADSRSRGQKLSIESAISFTPRK
jgi:hypothetical protein